MIETQSPLRATIVNLLLIGKDTAQEVTVATR